MSGKKWTKIYFLIFLTVLAMLYYGHEKLLGVIPVASTESTEHATASSLAFTKAPVSRVPIVILFTYQRCGSSFLGKLLDRNPESFYVYEPLDALYSAMYGTPEGWNVPSDIMNHSNGTLRQQPLEELQAVTEYLESLLTCRMDQLPSELFIHHYWHHKALNNGLYRYTKCVEQDNITNTCLNTLNQANVCPDVFGSDIEKEHACEQRLWLSRKQQSSRDVIPPPLAEYNECVRRRMTQSDIQKCIPIMQSRCDQAKVRSCKVVRASITSVLPLMRKHPEVKVIHLIRDPRAVARSRMKHRSVRGLFSEHNFTKEAMLYCRTVVHDLDIMEEMKKTVSGFDERVHTLVYEDFIKQPEVRMSDVYRFLGMDIPVEVSSFISESTKEIPAKTHWTSKMTEENVTNINRICEEFFNRVGRHYFDKV